MHLIVCGLADVEALIAARKPSHMISLLDPATMIGTPAEVLPQNHLRLGINDITEPMEEMTVPDEAAVGRILAFNRGWDASRC